MGVGYSYECVCAHVKVCIPAYEHTHMCVCGRGCVRAFVLDVRVRGIAGDVCLGCGWGLDATVHFYICLCEHE